MTSNWSGYYISGQPMPAVVRSWVSESDHTVLDLRRGESTLSQSLGGPGWRISGAGDVHTSS